ncbi:MAG: T9SS type A sorting domain-containing protein [Bacteroidetes bacterium]|nr:T9SS type A sorting domain-containing protein [Bacteroidota bacterium]
MKKLILIINILICYHALLQAQTQYFSRLYDYDNHINLAAAVINEDSVYTLAGDVATPDYRGIMMVKVDSLGDTIWMRVHGKAPKLYFTATALKSNNNDYILSGGIKDTVTGSSDFLLSSFNSNGDSLWMKRYGGAGQDYAYDCKKTIDGGYVMAGYTDSKGNGSADFWLVKTDSLGNLLWDKTYGGTGIDISHSVDQTKDKGFILSGSTTSFSSSVYIVKTDSVGNLTWQKTLNVNLSQQGGSTFQSVDGNYIIYGNKDDQDGNKRQGWIAKLGNSGSSLLWERTFGGQYDDWFGKVIELKDSSLMAIGVCTNDTQNFGWIMKSSSDGDSLWSRKYSIKGNFTNYFWDIESTSDKGFIICGWGTVNNQDMWLIKVDSMGCLVPGCDTLGTQIIEIPNSTPRISIYPNPFANEATVYIHSGYISKMKQGYFSLYDILGKEVRRIQLDHLIQQQNNPQGGVQFLLRRKGLPAGIYIYRVSSGNEYLAGGKVVVQ